MKKLIQDGRCHINIYTYVKCMMENENIDTVG